MGRFATASGELIDITNLCPEQVHLEDLAHHLAKIQRFGGATPINVTYSVGEHCINLAQYMLKSGHKTLAKMALLHDASEAYMSDIVSPVKRVLPDYMQLENKVQNIIYGKYLSVVPGADHSIYKMDRRILIDEVETVLPERLNMYIAETKLTKLGCHIEYNNSPLTIKICFLNLCKKLGIKDNLVL